MKQKILLMAFLLGLWQGCSQKVKETYKTQETMSIQNQEITADNIINKLTEQVKHYPQEPIYLASYNISWCFAEILVNDIPVYKNFSKPLTSSALNINHAIFKSGTQKVTYRLYPLGKIDGDDEIYNTLINNTNIKLSIDIADNITKQDEKFVKEYTSSLIPNPDKEAYKKEVFVGTGREYYEGSFTFEAEVPYQLEGFDKAQDLRKMDKQELETRLLKKYQEVWSIYQNKDYDKIARLSYDNLRNQFVSKYSDQKYIQDVWDMLMGAYKLNSFHMQPIENYEMKFFADGKLVALMSKSQEHWLRGNSAMWAEFDRGDGEETLTFNDYFYIPEGETGFKVY